MFGWVLVSKDFFDDTAQVAEVFMDLDVRSLKSTHRVTRNWFTVVAERCYVDVESWEMINGECETFHLGIYIAPQRKAHRDERRGRHLFSLGESNIIDQNFAEKDASLRVFRPYSRVKARIRT